MHPKFCCMHNHDKTREQNSSVGRVLASHQCVLSLIPRPGVMWVEFSPLLKNQHFQIPIRSGLLSGKHIIMSLWLGGSCKHSLCLTLNLHYFTSYMYTKWVSTSLEFVVVVAYLCNPVSCLFHHYYYLVLFPLEEIGPCTLSLSKILLLVFCTTTGAQLQSTTVSCTSSV